MKKTWPGFKIGSAVVAAGILCIPELSQAQGVTATISGVADSGTPGLYDYTITLNNPTDSVSIGNFWFDWTPGHFFLETTPSTADAPTGWTPSIQGGSIDFGTSTAPLVGGNSDTFNFTSTEAPSSVFEDSDQSPNPSSTVFTGATEFSGSSQGFNVTSTPEPSIVSLLAMGLAGGIVACKRRFQA